MASGNSVLEKDLRIRSWLLPSNLLDGSDRMLFSLHLLAKISKDDVSSPGPTTTTVDKIVDHTIKGLATYEGAAVDRRMASSILGILRNP